MRNEWITTAQAAAIIGCGRRHVVKLYHAGLLLGQSFGRALQIDRASAEGYTPNRDHAHLAIEPSQPYRQRLAEY